MNYEDKEKTMINVTGCRISPLDCSYVCKMTSCSLIQYHKTWNQHIYVEAAARHLWLDEHISNSHSGVF